jgi:hypothetical protein
MDVLSIAIGFIHGFAISDSVHLYLIALLEPTAMGSGSLDEGCSEMPLSLHQKAAERREGEKAIVGVLKTPMCACAH